MSGGGLVLVGLAMAVGIAGSVLPGLPGLPLSWAAVVVWAVADGGGLARWTVVAVVTAVAVAGIAAKYVLSGRAARAHGAPRTTLLWAAVGAVVGFFAVPVVGLPLGLVLGALLAEQARLRRVDLAWRSTRAVLVALGIGTLLEIAAGLTMVVVWLIGEVAT